MYEFAHNFIGSILTAYSRFPFYPRENMSAASNAMTSFGDWFVGSIVELISIGLLNRMCVGCSDIQCRICDGALTFFGDDEYRRRVFEAALIEMV